MPRWGRVVIVIFLLWAVYRMLFILFPVTMQSVMALIGVGAGASMMAESYRTRRKMEQEETEADKAELKADRADIDHHKDEIHTLNQQLQQIPLTVDSELKAELDNLAETKKQIADKEMSEDDAIAFLRSRLKGSTE